MERFDDAQRVLRNLLSNANHPVPDDAKASLSFQFGTLCVRQEQFQEAVEPLQLALAIRQQRTAGPLATSEVRSLLAEALTGLGEFDQANDMLLAALAELDQASAESNPQTTAIAESIRGRLAKLTEARDAKRLEKTSVEPASD